MVLTLILLLIPMDTALDLVARSPLSVTFFIRSQSSSPPSAISNNDKVIVLVSTFNHSHVFPILSVLDARVGILLSFAELALHLCHASH